MGDLILFDLWQEPEEKLFGGWQVNYLLPDRTFQFKINVNEKHVWAGKSGWAQYCDWSLVQFGHMTSEKLGIVHWNILAEGRCLTSEEAIQKGKAALNMLGTSFSTNLI